MGLTGVGPVLAARLLDRFGSLRGVLATEGRSLTKMAGCARKRAADIRACSARRQQACFNTGPVGSRLSKIPLTD
jgi:ERCC4-type nuclease